MAVEFLYNDQVISSWDVLIGGGDGKGEGVLSDIERSIEEAKIPKAKLRRNNVASGLAQAAFGGSRPFLQISSNANPNIKACKLYINTRDYGASLQVSWFLVKQPTFMQKVVDFLMRIPILGILFLPAYVASKVTSSGKAGTGILGLNLFDEQDLTAFATVAHHCVQDAVDKMTKEYNINLPRIDRTSKGFLNIT